jgi:hypothetical protein
VSFGSFLMIINSFCGELHLFEPQLVSPWAR